MYLRLSTVARKLNVSTLAIVKVLEDKGFHIENNPNYKLNKKQVDHVAEAFAKKVFISHSSGSYDAWFSSFKWQKSSGRFRKLSGGFGLVEALEKFFQEWEEKSHCVREIDAPPTFTSDDPSDYLISFTGCIYSDKGFDDQIFTSVKRIFKRFLTGFQVKSFSPDLRQFIAAIIPIRIYHTFPLDEEDSHEQIMFASLAFR